jgi:hypothetical protein
MDFNISFFDIEGAIFVCFLITGGGADDINKGVCCCCCCGGGGGFVSCWSN